jgi:hypothetical protein
MNSPAEVIQLMLKIITSRYNLLISDDLSKKINCDIVHGDIEICVIKKLYLNIYHIKNVAEDYSILSISDKQTYIGYSVATVNIQEELRKYNIDKILNG